MNWTHLAGWFLVASAAACVGPAKTGLAETAAERATGGGRDAGADGEDPRRAEATEVLGVVMAHERYKLPMAGGQPTLLATSLQHAALAVDDSGIYAAVRGAIVRVPLAWGAAQPLVQQLFDP